MVQPLGGAFFSSWTGSSVQRAQRMAQQATEYHTTQRQARASYQALRAFRLALEDLRKVLEGPVGTNSTAQTASASALGLDTQGTATTLTSFQQINNTPQYTQAPSFAGSSTSAPTLSGTWTGSSAETFTFRIDPGDADSLFKIAETSGKLSTVEAPTSYRGGQLINLGQGLQIAFSAGTLYFGDTFQVGAQPLAAVTVDPSDALGSASLEGGLSVVDGSFKLNGTSISVSTSDSLDDIIARINASGAGVTASFDARFERLVLTQDTTGSTEDIVFSDDSSGFVAAFKLDTAVSVAGIDPDARRALDQLSAFSSVSSGTLSINGTGIALDTSADSLEEIIARINASGAGAVATLSEDGDTFTLRARKEGDNLYLQDNTGLLGALGLSSGLIEGQRTATAQANQGAQALDTIARQLEHLAGLTDALGVKSLGSLGADLTSLFQQALKEQGGEQALGSLGLRFDLSGGGQPSLKLGTGLRSALARGNKRLRALFTHKGEDGQSLMDALVERLQSTEKDLRARYGHVGLLVSTYA